MPNVVIVNETANGRTLDNFVQTMITKLDRVQTGGKTGRSRIATGNSALILEVNEPLDEKELQKKIKENEEKFANLEVIKTEVYSGYYPFRTKHTLLIVQSKDHPIDVTNSYIENNQLKNFNIQGMTSDEEQIAKKRKTLLGAASNISGYFTKDDNIDTKKVVDQDPGDVVITGTKSTKGAVVAKKLDELPLEFYSKVPNSFTVARSGTDKNGTNGAISFTSTYELKEIKKDTYRVDSEHRIKLSVLRDINTPTSLIKDGITTPEGHGNYGVLQDKFTLQMETLYAAALVNVNDWKSRGGQDVIFVAGGTAEMHAELLKFYLDKGVPLDKLDSTKLDIVTKNDYTGNNNKWDDVRVCCDDPKITSTGNETSEVCFCKKGTSDKVVQTPSDYGNGNDPDNIILRQADIYKYYKNARREDPNDQNTVVPGRHH